MLRKTPDVQTVKVICSSQHLFFQHLSCRRLVTAITLLKITSEISKAHQSDKSKIYISIFKASQVSSPHPVAMAVALSIHTSEISKTHQSERRRGHIYIIQHQQVMSIKDKHFTHSWDHITKNQRCMLTVYPQSPIPLHWRLESCPCTLCHKTAHRLGALSVDDLAGKCSCHAQ